MMMKTRQDNLTLPGNATTMGRPVKEASTGNESPNAAESGFFAKVTPFKMVAVSVAIGIFGYLYISHVFYTQQLHAEVNQLQATFNQIRVDHNTTQLTYERMTGPADVYERAKSLGLIDGGPADKIIIRN